MRSPIPCLHPSLGVVAGFALLALSACSDDGSGNKAAAGGSAGTSTLPTGGSSGASNQGGSTNAGSTATGGSGGAKPVSSAPAGLDALPPFQSCQGERCNGQCITPETPKNEYCELVVPQYAPSGLFLAADGMLYVGHLGGFGKVAPTGGAALTPVTTDDTEFVNAVLVDGATAYFAVDLAGAGLFRVPTSGGPAEELVPGLLVKEMAPSAKGLVLTTGFLGLQWSEWDGSMLTDVGEPTDDTFLGDGVAYWNQFPDGMFKAPIDDLANATRVGEATPGDFVVQGGNVYAIGPQLNDLYFHGPDGGVDEKLWAGGTGDWEGDTNDIRVYPDQPDAVFFTFETKSVHYLMRWSIQAKKPAAIGSVSAGCVFDYTVAGDYAYLSGCQGVYRSKLP